MGAPAERERSAGLRAELSVRELVVEGLDVSDPATLGKAVSESLGRLLTERGLPAAGPVRPVTIDHDPAAGDRALAASIAEAIWSALEGDR